MKLIPIPLWFYVAMYQLGMIVDDPSPFLRWVLRLLGIA